MQAVLKQDKTTLVTWLPEDKRVKSGVRITLKGVDGWWTVMTCGDPHELPESAKHKSERWHDNDNHHKLGKLKIQ